MTVNTRISATDFNTIRNLVVKILGASETATPNFGYGQPVVSSAVSVGKLISVNDWSLLRFDIVSVQTHQQGSSSPLEPVINRIIKSDPTSEVYTNFVTLVNGLEANRFVVAAGQFDTVLKKTASYTTNWNQFLQTELKVIFASAQQARHFFNSGSTIQFASTRTLGVDPPSDQDVAWSNLLNTPGGPQEFGAVGSLGAVGITNAEYGVSEFNVAEFSFLPPTFQLVSYTALTSSYQTTHLQSSSGLYSANTYRIEAKCNVSDNSNGTANVVDFRISWTDGHTASGAGPDNVTGSINLFVYEKKSQGLLSPTGTFAITGPSYSDPVIGNSQTYAIIPSVTNINEGSTLTLTVITTNVPNGTTMFYDVEPVSAGLTASDFAATDTLAGIAGAVLAGSVVVSGNTGTVSLRIAQSDKVVAGRFAAYAAAATEGSEVFRVRLRTGGTAGTVRATTANITINDTATAALPAFIQIPTSSNQSPTLPSPHNIWYKKVLLYYRYSASQIKRLGWHQSVTINRLSYNQVFHPFNTASGGGSRLNFPGPPVMLPSFAIGLANETRAVPDGVESNPHLNSFVQVIATQNYTPPSGAALINWPFSANFTWDGSSNIIVCFARGQISGPFEGTGKLEHSQDDVLGTPGSTVSDLSGTFTIGQQAVGSSYNTHLAIVFYRA